MPALALIIHGDEDAGQRAFLLRLSNTTLKGYFPKSRIGRLPLGDNDPAVLSAWIAEALGIRGGGGVQTPAQLAEQVAIELKRQPLYFVLDRVADLRGGATAFRESFWVPFQEQLRKLRTTQQFDHRLVSVVVDYSRDEAGWSAATCEPDAESGEIDYSKLLRIRRLGRFKRADLLKWLAEIEVPDEPPGRRSQLVDRAMRDDEGKEDPVPLRVFERLRGETFWPEGDEE